MTIKSINYEEIISVLIDACSLTDDRKENLAIKRSFTTKQGIFSSALHKRLLNYLSGNDERLDCLLDNIFETLEESMKNLCSSPHLIDMNIETYNDEFKHELITPFIALLLFNLRFDFKKTSPIYYFIDFISKNLSVENYSLDALVREYIRNNLKSCDFPAEIGDDFKIFIGKISINSGLKLKTIDTKIGELRSEYDGITGGNTTFDFSELSLILHGMRLVLYFKEHINTLINHYNFAKKRIKNKESLYWNDLNKIAERIILRKRNNRFYIGFYEVIDKFEALSIKYHTNLDKKYNKHPNKILDYLMDTHLIRKAIAVKLLEEKEQLMDGIYHHMLSVFLKVQDGQFDLAIKEIDEILDKCEKYPNCRTVSFFSKIYIALYIKDNQKKIKNNTLDHYISKVISSESFKEKVTVAYGIPFLNQKSLFSSDAKFYTIFDSLSFWDEFIRETLGINVSESSKHEISFADKLEGVLRKIYVSLGSENVELSEIKDDKLIDLINSNFSTTELSENIITFIPNLSLYFALREINSICSILNSRQLLELESVERFFSESKESKKKLLKAINPTEYMKDEENELLIT